MTGLPLADCRVLDLSIARAGPVAVRLLADWGADVIRIEAPAMAGGSGIGGSHDGPDSQNLHRNKRGLAINLKSEAGQALFHRLVEQVDIVVENFRPDVKYRLGIDYETLRAKNPAIILASISGFGQTGPYSHRPAVDQVVQGMSGLMSITGEPGTGPMRVGVAISDTSAGMFLGQGILLALLQREKTGKGQWVHTSLLEAMLSKLDFQGARYTMSGEVPGQEGNNHPTMTPMGVFETSDGLVNLAASTDKMFSALCTTLGHPNLAEDERFQFAASRYANRQVLNEVVNEMTRQFSTAALVELANAAGCPCGPIYDVGEAFEDEHVRSLGIAKPASHPRLGDISLVRSPINLTAEQVPERFLRAGPDNGQHTVEILTEAGLTGEEIRQLQEAGVVQSLVQVR